MSVRLHWFLPTSGDGRGIVSAGHADGVTTADRRPDIGYLAQIARSAERLGFESVLTPTGTWCEDAWLVTAALIGETTRLKFLVAFRPGLISPTLAAQMAATYQRISRGRLLLNVVTGGQAAEQRRFGDHLSHDERYARTGEFLAVVRGARVVMTIEADGEPLPTDTVPSDLGDALSADRPASASWEKLAPAVRRGYVKSVLEAKKSETRARQFCIGGKNKPQGRLVLPLVPQHMKLRGYFLQIERDTVRLMCFGRGFDEARPASELANQRDLGRVR